MNTVIYEEARVALHLGDCVEVMRTLPEASVDAVVTDPPYALTQMSRGGSPRINDPETPFGRTRLGSRGGFMGKLWDDPGEVEDAAFGYYLAGLVDGEGHFRVQEQSRGTYSCAFAIKLRADDEAIILRARRFLRVGSVTLEKHEPHPMVKLVVQAKTDCLRIVEVFTRYPLRAKKLRDFLSWADAVIEWNGMKRGHRWSGRGNWSRLAALKESIEKSREYRDPPWSGHPYQDWTREWAEEALRVLKPGGHLVAFGGTRTYHRLACALEDAGFEIRDCLMWLYGQGFPKSLDVSKAIDKAGEWNRDYDDVRAWLRQKVEAKGLKHADIDRALGNENSHMTSHFLGTSQPMLPTVAQWLVIKELLGVDEEIDRPPRYVSYERAIVGYRKVHPGLAFTSVGPSELPLTVPATDAARQWSGWGTALKPAWEPILLARKPLDGTVAANVLKHGTGAINVDGCRIPAESGVNLGGGAGTSGTEGWHRPWMDDPEHLAQKAQTNRENVAKAQVLGRWPANLVLDEAAARLLDEQSGERQSGARPAQRGAGTAGYHGWPTGTSDGLRIDMGSGGASRFFYTSKAGTEDRDGSKHPTVKPVDLCKWLVQLVTPPGGLVLDPFMGSGPIIYAARELGFRVIGIDREQTYCDDAVRRLRQSVLPL